MLNPLGGSVSLCEYTFGLYLYMAGETARSDLPDFLHSVTTVLHASPKESWSLPRFLRTPRSVYLRFVTNKREALEAVAFGSCSS
jgi:hypothetical protein